MNLASAPAEPLHTLRAAELDQALHALRPAGSTLVITGDPGTGKHTLALLACAALSDELPAAERPRVIELNASETLAEFPFALLDSALDERALPEPHDPEAVYRAALADFAVAERSIVLVVADADSADDASMRTIAALAEHERVRTVFTVRDPHRLPGPLAQLVLRQEATSIALEPLSHAEHTALAAHLLGSATVEAETAARLFQATGGNPLFLGELLGQLRRAGVLLRHGSLVSWQGDEQLTRTGLPGLLARQLSQATEETRSALFTIAFAEPVQLSTLAKLGDVAAPEAVDLLLGHRLIRQDALPDGSLVIRTANQVIGDAARAAAPPGQRLRLLSAITATLPRDLAQATSATLLRGVGMLLDLGQPPGHQALLRALELTRGSNDHRMTIRISRALSEHPALSQAEQLHAAALRLNAARYHGSAEFLREPDLLDAPRGFTGHQLLPQPEDSPELRLARAELALARAEILLYRDDDVAGALALLEAFQAAAGPAGTPAYQRLLTGRFICLGYAGRFGAAQALARAELASPSAAESARIAGTLTLMTGQSGRIQEARDIAWRALAHTQELPIAAGEIFGALFAIEIANGQLGAATDMNNTLLEFLRLPTRRYQAGTGVVGIGSGMLALAEGRWGAAAAEFTAAARTLAGNDGTGFLQIALAGQALALAAGGRSDEAWEALVALDRTPARASRIAEGIIRLNTVGAQLWLNDQGAAEAAAALAEWARGHGFALIELRALHLRSLTAQPPTTAELLRAGELGEQLGSEFARDLVEAIGERNGGGPVRDSPAYRRLARQGVWAPLSWPQGLTPREREVAGLAVLGYSTKHIAGALSISARTAESHLARAFDKLGVNDRDGLAIALELRQTLRSQAGPRTTRG